MHKIVILGTSGCGKTTLAVQLGRVLSLPIYDLDDYYWLSNWQERPQAAFAADITAISAGQKWVFSGNSIKIPVLLERADTLIWLDYALPLCLFRAVRRALGLVWRQDTCCNGNRESLRRLFSKHSIVLWVLRSFFRRKKAYQALFHNLADQKTLLCFRTPHQTQVWLNELIQK